MLPEADENTKYITIDFPEDFPEEPYTEQNLVSPEEFEWGEYSLFVIIVDGGIVYPAYFSILSNNSPTFDKGNELYCKLNEKYLEEYSGEKLTHLYGLEIDEELSDYLYKSRVVYISPEAELIGRFKLTPNENLWNGQYDIIVNGKIDHSFIHNDIINNASIGRYRTFLEPIQLFFYDKTAKNITIKYNSSEILRQDVVSQRTNGIVFTRYSNNDEKRSHYFCSQDKSKLTHVITTNDSYFHDGYRSIRLWAQDGDIQLLEYSELLSGIYTQAVYSLNLNTGELNYLESFAYEPSISPDGKYLLYTGDEGYIREESVNTPPQRNGMYIKNLQTGVTVNYGINRRKGGGFISWVNEEKLMRLINE